MPGSFFWYDEKCLLDEFIGKIQLPIPFLKIVEHKSENFELEEILEITCFYPSSSR